MIRLTWFLLLLLDWFSNKSNRAAENAEWNTDPSWCWFDPINQSCGEWNPLPSYCGVESLGKTLHPNVLPPMWTDVGVYWQPHTSRTGPRAGVAADMQLSSTISVKWSEWKAVSRSVCLPPTKTQYLPLGSDFLIAESWCNCDNGVSFMWEGQCVAQR